MMNDSALARFVCGAHIDGLNGEEQRCREAIVLPIVNDGQYDIWVLPQDWHVAIGTRMNDGDRGTDTLVRCPQHCNWDGDRWIDAP